MDIVLYLLIDPILVNQSFHGKDNQQWKCVPIYGSEGAVFIQNVKSGNCIRNMG